METRCVLLGVGRLDAAAVATTSLVEFVAAREAAAEAWSGVDNDAVIVVFRQEWGLTT